MNIFSGLLSSTSDGNLAVQCAMNGWKVLYIGDPCGNENIIKQYKLIMAAPLVPDYNILVKAVDGYTEEFTVEYENQLWQEPASNFFLGIITAMFNGINIMMYFPKEVLELYYPQVLMNYIRTQFGIVASTENNQFLYDDDYNQNNLRFMYTFNTIDTRTFIINYLYQYDEFLIDKVIQDVRPYLKDPCNYNEKMNAILEYKTNLQNFLSKGINPIDPVKHIYDCQEVQNVSIW